MLTVSTRSVGERSQEVFPQYPLTPEIHPPQPMQLHLQTTNLFDDAASQFSDVWSFPATPVSSACYSDLGPEVDPKWFYQQPEPEQEYFGGITRAHTFPNHTSNMSINEPSLHSPIPSIQITSHDASPMSSPGLTPTISLPIRQEEFPPLQTQGLPSQMEYYSDFLSPTDQPPTVSRRSSLSFGNQSNTDVVDWTNKLATGRRRHTTCSITKPQTSNDAELGWMLSSPRTTNYLGLYSTTVQPQYPFLDLPQRHHQQVDTSPFSNVATSIKTYQRLLTAAIGAMYQHQSRDISSRYLRAAMALQKREDLDLFSSVSGIHCAMLLAIYLLHESETLFQHEEEDTSHPEVNLWLWSCRIAAACIDLGLHQWVDDMDADSELYRNTFQSVYVLDGKISGARKRPRAIHKTDVHPRLLGWIEAREAASRRQMLERSVAAGLGGFD